MTARKLSTGEAFVFDSKTKTLYLINKGEHGDTIEAAEKLVAAGKAHKYRKDQLRAIQASLSHIALLG